MRTSLRRGRANHKTCPIRPPLPPCHALILLSKCAWVSSFGDNPARSTTDNSDPTIGC